MLKNSNGNTYKIMESKEKYLLLENTTNNGNKYVVAYNYDESIQTWQQGTYFDNLEEAKNHYFKVAGNKKTILYHEEKCPSCYGKSFEYLDYDYILCKECESKFHQNELVFEKD